jgi:hypothetical protein
MITATGIVADFAKIQAKVTDIQPIAILSAVGVYSTSLLLICQNE